MALVHGNMSMRLSPALARYPAQDRLLFEEKCLHLDATRCVDSEVPNMAAVTSGIEFMLQIVIRSAYNVLQDHRYFDDAGLPDAKRLAELRGAGPRPFYNVTDIKERSAGMRQILEIDESENLDDGLTRSMQAYQQMADEKINTVITVESYVLAFNILFVVGLYVFVFRSVIIRLQTECTRTTQFVSMLPAQVIAQVPALHKYKKSND
eukprot:tig00000581_g2225.t1